MRIGVPKEVKNHEYRVAITPIGVHELVAHGHEVVVETGAGVGSSITDEDYVAAGASILPDADAVWQAGEMVLKVKEPVAEEYPRMREGQVLFTFLHLAADKPLTEELIARRVTAIAYETVQLPSGAVPHTSTYALTNATLPYVVALADRGWRDACRADASLALGLNTHAGLLANAPVGAATGIESVALADALA